MRIATTIRSVGEGLIQLAERYDKIKRADTIAILGAQKTRIEVLIQKLENEATKEREWEAYKAANTIFEDEEALREQFEEWYKKTVG